MNSNIQECKLCHIKKPRNRSGKYPDGRNTRWTDDNGREWCGRKCPECHVLSSKNTMKKIRSNDSTM